MDLIKLWKRLFARSSSNAVSDQMDAVLRQLERLERSVAELQKTHRIVAAVARRTFLDGID